VRDLPGGRRKSREILFRVLFEAEVGGEDPLELLEYTLGRYRLTADGRDYVVHVVQLFSARREEIDERIRARLTNWDPKRLSVTVRSVLRLAVAELSDPRGVPARVILDQAVELARKYGEDGAEGFVNGVLDPIGLELRPAELRGPKEA
jgi:transcription antitermination protein NusB